MLCQKLIFARLFLRFSLYAEGHRASDMLLMPQTSHKGAEVTAQSGEDEGAEVIAEEPEHVLVSCSGLKAGADNYHDPRVLLI
mmetsp:Transcript_3634/g.10710  ORF Transcript_3634/g.10710 Transcript_3634/m.10710 type:complete len:83 (-) Transcript_3634:11-259(-)